MPRAPKFDPIETPAGWMVSVPPTMAADRKRHRNFFATEREAARYASKLRGAYNAGQRAGLISVNLAVEAQEALKVLEPTGLGLVEAAKIVAQQLDSGRSKTLSEQHRHALEKNENHSVNSVLISFEDIDNRLDKLGKDRNWLSQVTGRSYHSIRSALAPKAAPKSRSALLQKALTDAIDREETVQVPILHTKTSKEDIKSWLTAYPSRDREWLAMKCCTSKRTVDNWLSTKKEMPAKALRIVEALMREDSERTKTHYEQMTYLTIPTTIAEFESWSKAALAKHQIVTEWALEAIRKAH
jgi:hypothetical protein